MGSRRRRENGCEDGKLCVGENEQEDEIGYCGRRTITNETDERLLRSVEIATKVYNRDNTEVVKGLRQTEAYITNR